MSQSESSAGSGSKKARGAPGVVVLNKINDTLDNFNNTIDQRLSNIASNRRETSPECRDKAVKCAQELETDLDNARLIALLDVFADTFHANVYLSFECEALRKVWVEKRLSELGFPDDHSIYA
jgi:hypothetical protein